MVTIAITVTEANVFFSDVPGNICGGVIVDDAGIFKPGIHEHIAAVRGKRTRRGEVGYTIHFRVDRAVGMCFHFIVRINRMDQGTAPALNNRGLHLMPPNNFAFQIANDENLLARSETGPVTKALSSWRSRIIVDDKQWLLRACSDLDHMAEGSVLTLFCSTDSSHLPSAIKWPSVVRWRSLYSARSTTLRRNPFAVRLPYMVSIWPRPALKNTWQAVLQQIVAQGSMIGYDGGMRHSDFSLCKMSCSDHFLPQGERFVSILFDFTVYWKPICSFIAPYAYSAHPVPQTASVPVHDRPDEC